MKTQARTRPRRPASGPRPAWLVVGALVLDTAKNLVGEVQQIGPGYDLGQDKPEERGKVWLRPPGGGLEWEAQSADLLPAGSEAA